MASREKFGRVWKRDAIEKELMQRDGEEEEEEEGRNNLKIHNQRAFESLIIIIMTILYGEWEHDNSNCIHLRLCLLLDA
ncbi:hypothetical protein DAPPUDRAFT_256001 [Daphnia pulex]|uniref:Uncharacterized protein n=1 Tax=Daphnia pulex TaxID=6669 RepID=E9HAH2_DAPPU|nr:hypothetical protein DAPPUDRAFT_256001 [Daphnia pulex]|eukprot:EFX71178.1 hypothetical protein DAPPUDRAFT_256001 [Daphnia pulex]